MTRRRAPQLPHSPPQPDWTVGLQEWKNHALRDVLSELQHICAGPRSLPKSFCLSEAVRHVVAREFDPESDTGIHLIHILSGAIARQIMRRAQMPAALPDGRDVPQVFANTYLNSRWWLDAFLQADDVCCDDVRSAVQAAIAAAEKETPQPVLM